jgi:hypothetical protein
MYNYKLKENVNPIDKITMDVPLFIRMLEFAREDAKSDLDLHDATEKAIALSETGRTLTMADYEIIVNGQPTHENKIREVVKKTIEKKGYTLFN